MVGAGRDGICSNSLCSYSLWNRIPPHFRKRGAFGRDVSAIDWDFIWGKCISLFGASLLESDVFKECITMCGSDRISIICAIPYWAGGGKMGVFSLCVERKRCFAFAKRENDENCDFLPVTTSYIVCHNRNKLLLL